MASQINEGSCRFFPIIIPTASAFLNATPPENHTVNSAPNMPQTYQMQQIFLFSSSFFLSFSEASSSVVQYCEYFVKYLLFSMMTSLAKSNSRFKVVILSRWSLLKLKVPDQVFTDTEKGRRGVFVPASEMSTKTGAAAGFRF
ncbi:hypothetical protein [Nitrosospira multiformis]|uniref:hypothetical protein n=1 Tax=Nitrosospira multiformis TaxID=1231 RepID=UPI001113499A|nr:hypothetical protein [Nitrosospira multiformis]